MDKKTVQPLTIRIPTDLHQQLAQAAKIANRTVNAEIVYRLRESVATSIDYSQLPAPSVKKSEVRETMSREELDWLRAYVDRRVAELVPGLVREELKSREE